MSQAFTRSVYSLVVIGGCLGVLVGCQKKPPTPVSPPVISKPISQLPRVEQALPYRKPGLWQTTVSEVGSEDTPQVLQICIDPITDRHLGILGTDLSGDKCNRKTVSHLPDGTWGLLAECDMGTGGTNQFSGSISGNYADDYTMKVRSQTTGASLPQMNRVTNYTVISKRQGDCSADQKPGDVINDGVKLNLFDMAGITPPPGAAQTSVTAAPTGD